MPHEESPGEGTPGLQGDFKTNCTQHQNFNLPVLRFKDLFLAYNGAHGRVRLSDIVPVGKKRKGKARTEQFAPTLGNIEDHLAGVGDSLGLLPLLDDGENVMWGAIDIDEYGGEFPFALLCEQIANHKLPLVVAKTKSGGAHCYLFLNEPTPASLVQSHLTNWASRLGYPGIEIFPKQTERKPGEIGGWLNMPYYGNDRHAFDAAGRPLSLPEFLDFAESRRVDASALVMFDDIPEAVNTNQPVEAPGRNVFLYALGGRLRERGVPMDEIERQLLEVNATADPDVHPAFADGPLPEADIISMLPRIERYEEGKRKVRPGIPPRPSPEEMPVAEAREALTTALTEWVNETLRRRQVEDDTPFHKLILAGAGLGKSQTLLKCLPKDDGLTFYYVPTVEVAQELAEKARAAFGINGLVVRGRRHADKDGKTLCARPKVVEEAVHHNIRNISQACCLQKNPEGDDFKCPHWDVCEYEAQFQTVPDVVFLSHQYLFQPMGEKLGKPDRIVIDEDLVKTLTVTPRHFSPAELEGPYADIIRDALEAGTSPKLALKEAGVTRKDLTEAATEIDKTAVASIHPAMTDKELKTALKNTVKVGPTPMVYRRLSEELNLEREETYSVSYVPEVRVKVTDEDGEISTERQPRIFVQYRRNLKIPKGVPALLLDATANPNLLAATFPELDTTVITAERNVRVVQVTHQNAGKGAMQKQRNLKDVGAFLMAVEALHGPGAVISHKDATELLSVPSGWTSGWFNNIRGSNAFEKCPVGVIIGRVEPPAGAVERLTRGLFYDKPVTLALGYGYVKTERGYRMKDGEQWGTDVSEHPDELVQAVLETVREAEIIQAVDRLRLRNDDKTKTIYLLCAIPVDLTVDELEPWNKLVGMRDRLERAVRVFGGLLPLRAAWLADRLPELWATPLAAESDIRRKTENSVKPSVYYNNIYSEATVWRLKTLSQSKAYEFRIKRQARPTRVWSHLTVADTRQWLEREFGPLIYFLPPMYAEFFPSHDEEGNEYQKLASNSLEEAYQMFIG